MLYSWLVKIILPFSLRQGNGDECFICLLRNLIKLLFDILTVSRLAENQFDNSWFAVFNSANIVVWQKCISVIGKHIEM